MEIVQSIEQLQQISAEIRSLRRGFITNFYLDPAKHGLWIAKGDCYMERIGSTLFIIKQSPSRFGMYSIAPPHSMTSATIFRIS